MAKKRTAAKPPDLRLHAATVVPLASLKPHPRNYKKHPAEQLKHLCASLRQYGQFREIVIARDGTILAGHGVAEAMRLEGYSEARCVRLDLDPMSAKALKVLALDNELPKFAESDENAMIAILREVAGGDDIDGLIGTGFDAIEQSGGVPDFAPGGEDQQGRIDQLAERCPTCKAFLKKPR